MDPPWGRLEVADRSRLHVPATLHRGNPFGQERRSPA